MFIGRTDAECQGMFYFKEAYMLFSVSQVPSVP